ncbi:NAD-dependent epimerase/dehydratase family protein [Mesorhizobium carmichaelinearum]|uniref:NAD-dependent epimerase/dehydratase family protein n=1 Tax=Mesorhizobium carmichaelinearum TaxID=1208188 RepID=UPI0015CED2D9|nr:NAD(P)-dependent oxidoreductase [Mesorhizobium carmichaelinearum]
MKVFVTGGSGFLAQRFIELAHRNGHEVICYDIVEPGKASVGTWIVGDITDYQALLTAMRSHQPEIVVHLATVLSDVCENDPVLGTRVNCVGTASVFQAAHEVGARRVIYASSVAVFTTGTSEIRGDHRPIAPEGAYGVTKAYGELLAEALARQWGAPEFLGLRFGWIYGAGRDRGWRALQQVIDDFLSGKTEVQYPDFSGANDWTFVTDAATTLLHCLTSQTPTVRAYNVTGDYRHVGDAVKHLQRRFPGIKAIPVEAEFPPTAWEFQCERLVQEVGYRPETSLESGLDKMILARGLQISEPDVSST